ncbi:MAG: RNA polymerase sigma factor [Sphingomonadales bacterium]|nr:RNA polymerase sigma factor [Sphingomonadales bacterium]
MNEQQDRVTAWIAREIVPHEGAVRGWLLRQWRDAIDVDDVIQECYCRIIELGSIAHIANGRAYFFRSAQSIAIDIAGRRKTASIVAMTESEWLDVMDEEPLQDRALEACQSLERVNGLLSQLTLTCRQVIELRRVEGLSQRETARRLGVSENVVENHIVRGLRKILNAIASQDADADEEEERRIVPPQTR